MSIALSVAALFIGFVTFSGYLLSQLWFNVFSILDTIVGVAGIATSAGAIQLAMRSSAAPVWVMWSSLAAILGIVAQAFDYYLNLNIPGNYFAWHINGPLLGCLCFVGFTVRYRISMPQPEA
jgi:ascorbate-specific PTS system EIIC-type component UlaA